LCAKDGTGLVKDANGQSPGMQNDAGVEWGRHFGFSDGNVFPSGPDGLGLGGRRQGGFLYEVRTPNIAGDFFCRL
jgi:hypothetical protein